MKDMDIFNTKDVFIKSSDLDNKAIAVEGFLVYLSSKKEYDTVSLEDLPLINYSYFYKIGYDCKLLLLTLNELFKLKEDGFLVIRVITNNVCELLYYGDFHMIKTTYRPESFIRDSGIYISIEQERQIIELLQRSEFIADYKLSKKFPLRIYSSEYINFPSYLFIDKREYVPDSFVPTYLCCKIFPYYNTAIGENHLITVSLSKCSLKEISTYDFIVGESNNNLIIECFGETKIIKVDLNEMAVFIS